MYLYSRLTKDLPRTAFMDNRNLHPLDPLSREEIQTACQLLIKQKLLTKHYRFVAARIEEPLQEAVLNFKENNIPDRCVFICVMNTKTNRTFEVIVNLKQEKVTRYEEIKVKKSPYGQPPILFDEYAKCENIVKSDAKWRAALKKRGLADKDIEHVQVDPFCAGQFGNKNELGKRIVRAVSYYKKNPNDNIYARPIEGLVAVVDLINETVIAVEDDKKYTPIPKTIINYESDSYPAKQKSLKPLDITQPEGPSFTVNGWEVEWQNWKFRVGFTPREGLVLHQISFNDHGKERPVIYRASISEMLVPYGDPGVSHYWKAAFDAGEYGLGTLARSLKLGCDCKGHIHYFDVPAVDTFGNAYTKEQVVCLHEEDAGILWKHEDDSRRARELVISFFPTIDNYDYGFYWRLSLDGSLRLEVKLTGIVQTAAIYPDTSYSWGGQLTPELTAPVHQHLFNARLHMMVDGVNNSFCQTEYARLKMNFFNNPYGTAIGTKKAEFKLENKAICDANGRTGRSWQIFNPSNLNSVHQFPAYKLEIPDTPLLLADKKSSISLRGGFAKHHIHVTPYDSNEKYASGDYPNQHKGGNGLPGYTKQKRSIKNKPLVVWVTFGPTHTPSPEEFPVMPVAKTSIMLKPFGFFSCNPAIDLPKECDKTSTKNNEVHCCH